MAKDPAFLFYFRDFLVSTELMSAEDIGSYIRILCHMADKGRLTLKHMQSICKAYGIAHPLHSKFKQDENGLFFNVRLEEEVQKRSNYTQSRRDNAKHMYKHMHMHMGNANISEDAITPTTQRNNIDTKFIAPTIVDCTQYWLETSNVDLVPPQIEQEMAKFIDFYQSKGWMVGKTKMKDWRASWRNWHRKNQGSVTASVSVKPRARVEEMPTRKAPDPAQQEEVAAMIRQTAQEMGIK